MHELERGQMLWGEWSEHSRALVTDRQAYRGAKPARHLWVLVHGLRGDTGDMKHLAGAISSRWRYCTSFIPHSSTQLCTLFWFKVRIRKHQR